MKMKSSFKKVLIGIVGLLTAASLFGCHRHKSPEEKAKHVTEKISSKLDMNELQKTKLQDLSKEIVAVMNTMRESREQDFATVLDQVKGESFDKAAVMELYKKRRDTLDQAFPEIVNKLADLHASLDEKQKAEIASKLEWHKN